MKKIIAIISIFFLLIGCKQKEQVNPVPRTVFLTNVESSQTQHQNNYSGLIKEFQKVRLSYRIPGQIMKLNVKEGQYLKKGDVIASLDKRDYQLKVNATQAQYKQVKAETDRIIALYKKKGVSTNDYDKAISGQIMITAKRDKAVNDLNDCDLIAPFDGYIQDVYFREKEAVAAGTPVVSFIQKTPLIAEINVPSQFYQNFSNNIEYWGTPENQPNKKIKLKFYAIQHKANANHLYTVQLLMPKEKTDSLAPGMTIAIHTSAVDNAVKLLPANAIFYEKKQTYVWTFDGKRVHKTAVEVGDFVQKNKIEILNGLTLSDVVVVAGIHSLRDNQQVRPVEKTATTNVGGLL